jgi:hypothetical protein
MVFSRKQIIDKICEKLNHKAYNDIDFLIEFGLKNLDKDGLDEDDFDSVYFLTIMNYNGYLLREKNE